MRKADPQRWTASPFLPAVLVAAFLVAVLQRPHAWILAKLNGRKKTAAALATAAVTLVLFVPIGGFAVALASEIPGAMESASEWLGPEGLAALPRKLPPAIRPIAAKVMEARKPTRTR